MREIKFRGKREDSCDWVFGDYGQFHKHDGDWTHEIHCPIPKISGSFWNEVVPETVGQYTGRVDCNNVKIFEGDIVLYNEKIGNIFFADGSFSINFGIISLPIYNYYDNDIEVIGNIHDNRELMGLCNRKNI